jgi:hypothetical protein
MSEKPPVKLCHDFQGRPGNRNSVLCRSEISDIAGLYQHIHGEWPLRETEPPDSSGPLDEIMTILGDVPGCGSLGRLLGDLGLDLGRIITKEQAAKLTGAK